MRIVRRPRFVSRTKTSVAKGLMETRTSSAGVPFAYLKPALHLSLHYPNLLTLETPPGPVLLEAGFGMRWDSLRLRLGMTIDPVNDARGYYNAGLTANLDTNSPVRLGGFLSVLGYLNLLQLPNKIGGLVMLGGRVSYESFEIGFGGSLFFGKDLAARAVCNEFRNVDGKTVPLRCTPEEPRTYLNPAIFTQLAYNIEF
jgi:hypothetical protein